MMYVLATKQIYPIIARCYMDLFDAGPYDNREDMTFSLSNETGV